MMIMIMLTLLFLLISVALFIISLLVGKNNNFDREKSSPFECGFDPFSSSRVPFSIRFFTIAVIFLVFDVEIVLLLPMSMNMESPNMSFWFTIYLVFLMMLMIGTVYEWSYGALYWKY